MFTHASKTDSNKTQAVSVQQEKAERLIPDSLQEVSDTPGFLLSQQNILQLQRTIGNRAVIQLLTSQFQQQSVGLPVQRMEFEEEKFRVEQPDKEDLRMKQDNNIQSAEINRFFQLKEKETLTKRIPVTKLSDAANPFAPRLRINTPSLFHPQVQKKEDGVPDYRGNNTGMPDNLKSGLETLSGLDLSDVHVHYNSNKPGQVGALAYAQNNDIHIAPGQEKHLSHEGWHVVQQRQGRVSPTLQLQGMQINDDEGLEKEADTMGKKASVIHHDNSQLPASDYNNRQQNQVAPVVQRIPYYIIDVTKASVEAVSIDQEISWEEFTDDYSDLYEEIDGNVDKVKLTDDQHTAIGYNNGVIIQVLRFNGEKWVKEDEADYNQPEVDYVLDRTEPDDQQDLEITQLLIDGTEDEDLVNGLLDKLYNSVSDLPLISAAAKKMNDATDYEWKILLTRLTQGLNRKIISDVLEKGVGHFSIGALLSTMANNSSTAVERVEIASGWGNNDNYLTYAENMGISKTSSTAHCQAAQLVAAVRIGAAIIWARPQVDVAYRGGQHQQAEPRTGFLRATVNGTQIDIHAHWHRLSADGQTAGKITSVHVQFGGENALEINHWNFMGGLMQEIVRQFNADGANRPQNSNGTGPLNLFI